MLNSLELGLGKTLQSIALALTDPMLTDDKLLAVVSLGYSPPSPISNVRGLNPSLLQCPLVQGQLRSYFVSVTWTL